MTRIASIAALALAAGVATASSPFLLVPNSNTDTIHVFDAFDGSLIDTNFIDHGAGLASFGYTGSSTPLEAIEVGNEIWVSDQLADRIVRYNKFTAAPVGQIGVDATGAGLLNNLRGITLIGNTVYGALGGDSSAYVEGLVEIDASTGAIGANYNGRDGADTSYYDVISLDGTELLVTNADTGNDGIERYDLAGNYLGNLISSDGVASFDFPQQMNLRSAGNILIGGFSVPSGVYEVTPGGVDNGIVAADGFGPRAAYELGNGSIAWSNGTWFRTDADIFADGGSWRFINPSTVPAPGAMAAFGVLGLAAARRRR